MLYRFDAIIRSSLVFGRVGVGGIGVLINPSIKSFRLDALVTHIMVILVSIILADQLPSFIRRTLEV